ncbi:MAG: hypothetical protein DME02_15810 [Candidatus Rokuibacteriota bacterium]|nr:MAG: hypothetical protein DME02_15810 [Candidatus Rokubacteria bacterium]
MIRSADVVVVGSGAFGASAAYHLARRGVRVAVLDRGTMGTWLLVSAITRRTGAAPPADPSRSLVTRPRGSPGRHSRRPLSRSPLRRGRCSHTRENASGRRAHPRGAVGARRSDYRRV